MKRIALVTCEALPEWEVDDSALRSAFRALGVSLEEPAWSADVDWGRYDACLIRTTWDYMERRQEYLAWAEHVAKVCRLFNPAPVLRWNTHKGYLRHFEGAGIPLAPTRWLSAGSALDLKSTMQRERWTRAIIKPMVGAGARDTLRFSHAPSQLREAQAHLDRLLPHKDLMLQPYLPSVETEGELSAIFLDGRLTHAVRKVPVPGDFRVQDDFGASDEAHRLSRRDRALAEQVWEQAQQRFDGGLLYGRIDFLRNGQGQLVLNEVELVEPSLFFRHAPEAAEVLARGMMRRLEVNQCGGSTAAVSPPTPDE